MRLFTVLVVIVIVLLALAYGGNGSQDQNASAASGTQSPSVFDTIFGSGQNVNTAPAPAAQEQQKTGEGTVVFLIIGAIILIAILYMVLKSIGMWVVYTIASLVWAFVCLSDPNIVSGNVGILLAVITIVWWIASLFLFIAMQPVTMIVPVLFGGHRVIESGRMNTGLLAVGAYVAPLVALIVNVLLLSGSSG